MRADACLPVSFEASAPSAAAAAYLDDPSIRLLVGFFQAKGLDALKREEQREDWYPDWLDFQAAHGLYASLLSPSAYSSRGHRFSFRRLARFLETFAYFSPSHAYSLHVSFLGLFPILMSANEALKSEAVAKLEAGGLFAFGVSEKAHGSDLFANEMTVTPAGPDRPGRWVLNGSKYYIGNANAASMVSVLARFGSETAAGGRRLPFAFVAVRPPEAPAYGNVRKIRTLGIRAAFVGAFDIRGHEFPETDLISRGRDAWGAVFSTVDFGKFLLGFGAIGICEHALAEAVAHMRGRVLYGKPVTEMPHLRTATVLAFTRLLAMKLFATRALDYLEAAGPDERRYLLFTSVQKARVSTEGVKVMGLLYECVGARGAEAETYFEGALRDAQLVPGMEGSTHINFGLAAQFVAPYFGAGGGVGVGAPRASGAAVPPPFGPGAEPVENPSWMGPRDGNAKTVRFAPFLAAYEPLRAVPNVGLFTQQAEALRRFAERQASEEGSADVTHVLAMGRCLSVVAYAQLVAENGVAVAAAPSTISLLFHGLVEDLSAEALRLSAMLPAESRGRADLWQAVRVPTTAAADFDEVAALIAARYA